MHIGLIGGIGPAATIYYYKELAKLFNDAKQKMALTIVNTDSREMVANLVAKNTKVQASIFAAFTAQLKAPTRFSIAPSCMRGPLPRPPCARLSR